MDSPIEKYAKVHGDYVTLDAGWALFADGAQCENSSTGVGPLISPPDDEWERTKLIEQYWEMKAQAAEDAFYEFKAFLHGTGACPPGIDSREDQIAYLKTLRATATAAGAKFRKARKAVKDATPYWLLLKRKEESRQRRQREVFMDEIKSIDL